MPRRNLPLLPSKQAQRKALQADERNWRTGSSSGTASRFIVGKSEDLVTARVMIRHYVKAREFESQRKGGRMWNASVLAAWAEKIDKAGVRLGGGSKGPATQYLIDQGVPDETARSIVDRLAQILKRCGAR
jgi:hypothetical protein